MKSTIVFLFLSLSILPVCSSQNSAAAEPAFEINRIYPFITVSKEQLLNARTLTDIDPKYKAAWVKEYISVEVTTTHNGQFTRTVGRNHVLSPEQKLQMDMADTGSDISVVVHYLPDNNLKHNDIQTIDFTFSVDPELEAQFPGGRQLLLQYLQENAIDKIPGNLFKGKELAAIKFTINEEGETTDVRVFESSRDEKTDALLSAAIRNMPAWEPARYSNGVRVKQEFVLTVGNMNSCVINLLNIHPE